MIEINTDIIYYGFENNDDAFQGIDVLYEMSPADL